MPHVDDTADLLQRVEAGASVRTIAAELDVTERTVRNRLKRAGIPLPSTLRYADVDLEPILDGYRAGTPVATLAEQHGVGTAWLRRRIADSGIQRDAPMTPRQRPPRFPEVGDRRWLLERIARGDSIYAVAKRTADWASDRRASA